MSKINNKNTSEWRWRRSGVFIANFEHISYFTPCSSVSIVDFEHAIADWVITYIITFSIVKKRNSKTKFNFCPLSITEKFHLLNYFDGSRLLKKLNLLMLSHPYMPLLKSLKRNY